MALIATSSCSADDTVPSWLAATSEAANFSCDWVSSVAERASRRASQNDNANSGKMATTIRITSRSRKLNRPCIDLPG